MQLLYIWKKCWQIKAFHFNSIWRFTKLLSIIIYYCFFFYSYYSFLLFVSQPFVALWFMILLALFQIMKALLVAGPWANNKRICLANSLYFIIFFEFFVLKQMTMTWLSFSMWIQCNIFIGNVSYYDIPDKTNIQIFNSNDWSAMQITAFITNSGILTVFIANSSISINYNTIYFGFVVAMFDCTLHMVTEIWILLHCFRILALIDAKSWVMKTKENAFYVTTFSIKYF